MRNLQVLSDKAAIGLSLVCTVHCLILPLIIVLLPSLSTIFLADESFHKWMVFAVVPTSIYALTLGCRKHKHYHLLTFGAVGVTCLVSAVIFGESFPGEVYEKILTLIGAGIIAYGHFRNYRLCKIQNLCDCAGDY